jgi:hypothetical protein
MVTGRPFIAVKMPSKSSRWYGSSFFERRRARCRLGEDHLAHRVMRSPSKNMCSVRHRPMPSAPKSRARLRVGRRVGVGPHAERAVLVGPAS